MTRGGCEFGLFGGEKMRIAWWCDMRPLGAFLAPSLIVPQEEYSLES